jgi:DNA primase
MILSKSDMKRGKRKMDLNEIKQILNIEKVLNYYGITGLKRSGNTLYGACPVHHGDNPRAFNVNLEKNLWNCFTHCGGGSVIDLVMKMENISLYEAILKAEDMIGGKPMGKRIPVKVRKAEKKVSNLPLEFKLTLDPGHRYLKERRVLPETASYFGIGYCRHGILRGRIAIPIHDDRGQLVAYCGRSIGKQKPKYRFPRGFRKSLVLYNYHNVKNSLKKDVVVVEGYFDLYRVFQAGYDCIALMGRSISQVQEKLLLNLDKRLILMFDGDKAGKDATKKAIQQLQGKMDIFPVYLPNNIQPDDMGENEIINLLSR